MSLCGYRKLQADRARTRWLINITSTCTRWADNAIKQQGFISIFYALAKYCILFAANIVNTGWLVGIQLMWLLCRLFHPHAKKQNRIKHVFVVMLENRSFDHLLGFSQLQGTDAITGQPTSIEGVDPTRDWNLDKHGNKVPAFTPAAWTMPHDPGHEFNNVQTQLCGDHGTYPHIDNSGFILDYAKVDPDHAGDIMQCYTPEQVPIITRLAHEFAVCDHWFSSMPGPTWPNRFFLHAASSGGLDHSPSSANMASSVLLNGYKFENDTIFDRLDYEGLNWKIYQGDLLPQSLAISGMLLREAEGCFKDFEDFQQDVNDPNYDTTYAFIEPDYHILSDFVGGNSQHPRADITNGEALLKHIYETIHNSPHWEESALIITYDEHGGFYDHIPPPQTVAPGDAVSDPENTQFAFDFTQLGVRVPAIVVSPLIPKSTIDHTVYDHTSVLATLETLFGLLPLTKRDAHAHPFNHLFSLTAPRTDTPTTLPEPAHSGIPQEKLAQQQLATHPINANEPPDAATQAFLHVAFLRDTQNSTPSEKDQKAENFIDINTNQKAKTYLLDVQQKVGSQKT